MVRVGTTMIERDEARLWAKIDLPNENGCMLWSAGTRSGYGMFRLNGKMVESHRVVYEHLVGPIPEGMELDHVRKWGCRSRACSYIGHLEPVTKQENIKRGDAGLHHSTKTHCPHGHEYNKANTRITPNGKRKCRTCHRGFVRNRPSADKD